MIWRPSPIREYGDDLHLSKECPVAAKPLRADARRNRDALVATAREVFDTGRFFDLRMPDRRLPDDRRW